MSENQTEENAKLKYQIEQLNRQISELSVKNERQYNELCLVKREADTLQREKDKLFVIIENLSRALGGAGK